MSHPTPSLSHLTSTHYQDVYEPAEDSFLLMDALEKEKDELEKLRCTLCVYTYHDVIIIMGTTSIVNTQASDLFGGWIRQWSRNHFLGYFIEDTCFLSVSHQTICNTTLLIFPPFILVQWYCFCFCSSTDINQLACKYTKQTLQQNGVVHCDSVTMDLVSPYFPAHDNICTLRTYITAGFLLQTKVVWESGCAHLQPTLCCYSVK